MTADHVPQQTPGVLTLKALLTKLIETYIFWLRNHVQQKLLRSNLNPS